MCIQCTVFHRSDAAATNFFISLEPAVTIPRRHLLEGVVNKHQLGNTYKINTHHDCRAVQQPRGRGCKLLIGVWQVGSNWNMWLLYEGGDKIVQSHAARGNNSRAATT